MVCARQPVRLTVPAAARSAVVLAVRSAGARKSRFGRALPAGVRPLTGGETPRLHLGGSLPSISMKELLEAGVHFGHQTKRWNPKMKEYIFGERNGIYIIDLQKTLKLFKDAMRFRGRDGRAGQERSCSSAPSARRRKPSPKRPRAAACTT